MSDERTGLMVATSYLPIPDVYRMALLHLHLIISLISGLHGGRGGIDLGDSNGVSSRETRSLGQLIVLCTGCERHGLERG